LLHAGQLDSSTAENRSADAAYKKLGDELETRAAGPGGGQPRLAIADAIKKSTMPLTQTY
jgi:hypothetical protein